jgi:uncharacterized protein (TIGR03118 family)
MYLRSVFHQTQTASDRQCYRPVLELLEGRCLLSRDFTQINLASDVPGWARVTDPDLVNPWGVAFSPTGPFWFADNGSSVSDLLDGRGQRLPLVVSVPSALAAAGSPTGTVFNGGAGFVISANGVSAPSRFLFAGEDGTISGWSALVDPTVAVLVVDRSSSDAVYKGLALASDPAGNSFLYAADFRRGTIDVFNQGFQLVVHPGSFQDPNLPAGYAPFNVQNINDLLFVSYAQQDAERHDDVPGAGHGFIDVYDADGTLVRRFASAGALNSPWGLALAPLEFGPFGGALLVGNVGDGHISAYDLASGSFLGQLADDHGTAIAIPTLWALTFGNGHAGGDSHTLFFTAGVGYEEHGLFGAIQSPDRRGADTGGSGTFDPNAPGEPGDYQLPPRDGPSFRANSPTRPLPNVELLPLRESSLLLIPTLTSISMPPSRIETPAPARYFGTSLGESAHPVVPPSEQVGAFLTEEFSMPASRTYHDALTLDAFLDVNPLDKGPQPQTEVQFPSSRSFAVAAGSSAFAGCDGGPALSSQSGDNSGIDSVAGEASTKGRNRPGWINLMGRLLVISVPLIWACWGAARTRHHSLPSGQSANE